jgi:AGZA family xanthine/uracil permease-like MFS transporter
MKGCLNRFFHLEENGTSIKHEFLGGLTTFLTMSYIIFVQPAILSGAGMDRGAVLVATCLSCALATLLMGLLANYPIALAPGMGLNVFFAVTVCTIMGYSWQVALGAVFISGMLFILLSVLGVWGKLVEAVPASLKNAIAVGIGFLIAMIGLQYGGIVVGAEGTLVGMGDLGSKPVLLVLFGIILTSVLMALRIRGAILFGVIATAVLALPLGLVQYSGLVSAPPSLAPTFLKLDILGALNSGLVTVIFTFFFIDLFDTMGTLIGVSVPAGFLKDNKLPRANKAMLADALGTVSGALLGTSTITSYIESSTGVEQGARTGLANVFTSFFFIVALFFSPLAEMIGGQVVVGDLVLRPVIAPPLIIVGYLMMKCVGRIDWNDLTEAIPSFLTIIIMPLTLKIHEGISFGFIAYALIKLASGRGRDVHWIIYLFALLFIVRYFVQ